MKKTIILRIIVGVMAICLSILVLTIAYFFNTDIETREPRKIIEECEINTSYIEQYPPANAQINFSMVTF